MAKKPAVKLTIWKRSRGKGVKFFVTLRAGELTGKELYLLTKAKADTLYAVDVGGKVLEGAIKPTDLLMLFHDREFVIEVGGA